MPRAFLVLVLIGAFGVAAQGEEAQESTAEEQEATPAPPSIDLDEILSNPLTEGDYREQSSCIWHRQVEHVEVLDETLIVFEGRRGELWLNQLTNQCHRLEADMVLSFRVRGGHYCRLDAFRGIPKYDIVPVTPVCTLGSFERVDEVQLDALRIAVAERQRVSNMATETRRQQRRQHKSED